MASSVVADARQLLVESRDQLDRDPEEALRLAQRSEELFKEHSDVAGGRDAFRAIVGAMLTKGEHEAALHMVSDGLALAKRKRDDVGAAVMQLATAELNLAQGKGDDAIRSAQAARETFRAMGDTKLEGNAAIVECHGYFMCEDVQRAESAAQSARGLAESSGDIETAAKAWHMLANAREQVNDIPSAMQAARAACDRYKENGDRKPEALVLCSMSRLLVAEGNSKTAMELAMEAVNIFENLGLASGQVIAVQAAVEVRLSFDEQAEAMNLLQGKKEEFERSHNRDALASLLLLIADVNLLVEDFSVALRSAQAARDIFVDLGDERQEAAALLKLSSVNYLVKRYYQAIEDAHKSLDLYRKHGLRGGESEASRALATIYTEKGEPEKSPLRQEAMRCIDTIAQAVEKRDSEAYEKAVNDLSKYGGATDKEIEASLRPIIENGGKEVRNFLRANDGSAHNIADAAEEIERMGHYHAYMTGGLQYGPAFRSVKACWRHGAKGSLDTEVLTVLQLHDNSEDWEENMQILHPGIFDSLLQSMMHIR